RPATVTVTEHQRVLTILTDHQGAVPEHSELLAHQLSRQSAGQGLAIVNDYIIRTRIQVLHELTFPELTLFEFLSLTSQPLSSAPLLLLALSCAPGSCSLSGWVWKRAPLSLSRIACQ